jgi:uncharacterized protein (DUF1697 family)
MQTLVVLLRGINVGGNKSVPMTRLRELCEGAGLADVRSYIQSGNLVAGSDRSPAEVAALVAGLVKSGFGHTISVIARTAAQWRSLAIVNPFPEEAKRSPSRLMLLLGQGPAPRNVAKTLAERATAGERIAVAGGATWIFFPEGIATTKLTPTVLDKAHAEPVTARNWTTVVKLREMACPPEG